jgi:hypothetical protein
MIPFYSGVDSFVFILVKLTNISYIWTLYILSSCIQDSVLFSARFTYRLDGLKPRASRFRGPLAKVYNIFNTVIGLSLLCCHNVLYFLNNPSVIFLTQLHSISEYCRILSTPTLFIFAFLEID